MSNTFNFADIQSTAFNIYELRKKLSSSFEILLSDIKARASALEQPDISSSETFTAIENDYNDSSSSDSDTNLNKYRVPQYRNPFDEE